MAFMKVRYKGLADVRQLSAKDVKDSSGIEMDNDVTWSAANNNAVVMDVSPQMEELLRAQGHFSLSALKDDGSEGEVVATATDTSNEGDVLVDGTTGAKTQAKK